MHSPLYGITCCTRSGSSPSHSGFCAVPSKIDVVLNSSNSPVARGLGRLRQQRRHLGLAHRAERARGLERLLEELHAVEPVMTTEVGRFSA